MTRSDSREKAFQAIYSQLFNTELDFSLETNDENSKRAKLLVDTYIENRVRIENTISTNLKGYTISRLNKIDLSIIILAIIELQYLKDEPKQIVINEAVELAKKYSTEKSPRFINGFLAGLVN